MGGGLIAVNKKYASQIIKIKNSDVETLFVIIKFKRKNLIINATYIPPNSKIDLYSSYVKLLDEVYARYPNSLFVLCGDYNLPFLCWSHKGNNGKIMECSNENDSSDVLINAAAFYGLDQVNFVLNKLNRILDLMFVNFEFMSLSCTDDTLVPVDAHHPALVLQFRLNESKPSSSNVKEIFCFRKSNFDLLNEYLSNINWDVYLDNYLSLDKQVDTFYDTLQTGFQSFVPKSKVGNFKFPIWCSKLLKEKDIAPTM